MTLTLRLWANIARKALDLSAYKIETKSIIWSGKFKLFKTLMQNFNIKVCDLDRKVIGMVGHIAELNFRPPNINQIHHVVWKYEVLKTLMKNFNMVWTWTPGVMQELLLGLKQAYCL